MRTTELKPEYVDFLKEHENERNEQNPSNCRCFIG